jgi:hypothetical protein
VPIDIGGGLLVPPQSTLPSIDTHSADFDRRIAAMPPQVRATIIYYKSPDVPDCQGMLGGAMSHAVDLPSASRIRWQRLLRRMGG